MSTLPQRDGLVGINRIQKRVWKACARCRLKKTKCDGASPCKRCSNDDQICNSGGGGRSKTALMIRLPGYVEALEESQRTLVSAVHRLYQMVYDADQWKYETPKLTDHGVPCIHSIIESLGCLRPLQEVLCDVQDSKDVCETQSQQAAFLNKNPESAIKHTDFLTNSDTCPATPFQSACFAASRNFKEIFWVQEQQLETKPVATQRELSRALHPESCSISEHASTDKFMSCSPPFQTSSDMWPPISLFDTDPPDGDFMRFPGSAECSELFQRSSGDESLSQTAQIMACYLQD